MSEIYLKIYVENGDTLVFEGQGCEEKDGYYPSGCGRFGTAVVGAEHIAITNEAKEAFRRVVCESKHTGDDLSCIDIHSCYSKTDDGKIDEEKGCDDVCVSYLGDIITKLNIEEIINDNEFFIGCGEGCPELNLLDKLVLID